MGHQVTATDYDTYHTEHTYLQSSPPTELHTYSIIIAIISDLYIFLLHYLPIPLRIRLTHIDRNNKLGLSRQNSTLCLSTAAKACVSRSP